MGLWLRLPRRYRLARVIVPAGSRIVAVHSPPSTLSVASTPQVVIILCSRVSPRHCEASQRDEQAADRLSARHLREVAARFADLYADAADFDHAFPPLTAHSNLDAQQAREPMKQMA